MIFILMIVFQLTGAVVLLCNSINGSKERIIRNCFSRSNFVKRDNNNCIIEKERLQKSARSIYINRIAFIDLVIGYTLAAINPSKSWNTYVVIVSVIAVSLLLTLIEIILCGFYARKEYKDDLIIPYDSIKTEGIITNITNKEIDELFSNIWGGSKRGQERHQEICRLGKA